MGLEPGPTASEAETILRLEIIGNSTYQMIFFIDFIIKIFIMKLVSLFICDKSIFMDNHWRGCFVDLLLILKSSQFCSFNDGY